MYPGAPVPRNTTCFNPAHFFATSVGSAVWSTIAISAPSRISGYCSGLMSGSLWIRTLGSPGCSRRSMITARASLASTKTPRMTLSLRSGCDAGDRQHRVHEDIGARGAIGLRGVFQLIVADAVLAGHEHHCGRHDWVEIAGVMAGAGGDAARGTAERLRRVLDGRNQLGIEMRRRLAPDQVDLHLDLAACGDLGNRAAQIAIERIHDRAICTAAIHREGDLAGNDVARRVCDHGLADGADCLRPVLARNGLHRQHDLGQRRQRVAPQRHRRRPGMALEAGNLAVVPKYALAGIDDTDGLAFGFQDRALLDVQLDETAELLETDRLVAAITDVIERLAHAGAVSVFARQDVVGGEVADISGGGHHRGSEA